MKDKLTGKEKHYYKLNIKLQQELKELQKNNAEIKKINYMLQNEVAVLKIQIKDLNAESEYLKSKLNLSDEEVKQLVSSSKAINDFYSLINAFKL